MPHNVRWVRTWGWCRIRTIYGASVRHYAELTAVLAKVLGLVHVFALYIVEEDIRVCADAIIYTCLATAGEGNVFRVRTPCQLLYATERLHGAFKGIAFEDVNGI